MIKKFVLKNLIFHWRKALLTTLLVASVLFLASAALLFTQKVKALADAPLNALQTELVLQEDATDKNPGRIKTSGVITPFNLKAFPKDASVSKLAEIDGIEDVSTALVLWQFDITNNRTIVGLDVNDPQIGLRGIERWLMPKSAFFSDNTAQEVILERHFAKLFGFQRGGTYRISGKDYAIIGIVDFKEQSNLANAQVFMPYDTARALINKKDAIINQLYISVSKASHLPAVQNAIGDAFPQLSILTKDRLLKNLSSFNSLIYQFGDYFALTIATLSLFLAYWILKMHRMEFGNQIAILKLIGWPKTAVMLWILTESAFIALFALGISTIFLLIFWWGILPQVSIDTLSNQSFTL